MLLPDKLRIASIRHGIEGDKRWTSRLASGFLHKLALIGILPERTRIMARFKLSSREAACRMWEPGAKGLVSRALADTMTTKRVRRASFYAMNQEKKVPKLLV
ncbi:hypothetical protein LIA77_08345 [Sarocladium implicatum]|nr:hypothetical protein LIA77_08345 [Sarocladium implicatum]